jgi:hypothetical protein
MVNEQSGGYNKFGLCLALLALYEFDRRPSQINKAATQKQSSSNVHWAIPAVTLGSLIFSLHSLLSDPSTLIAWSWTGFQNGRASGPIANLHGSLTIIAQCIGISIPIALAFINPAGIALLEHPLWFMYGAANSIIMYRYRNWLGYVGGLQLAMFLMSIVPLVLQRAQQIEKAGKTYFTALLVYCVLSLGSVWTVAYAFVPGGVYFRERTDL